ncbi:NAD-P-binding protein [Amylostereum chailletii]|nr:NAD-P-binding protein [Amylostereum chailletii]
MSSKPSVIILGGVNTCARSLASYLVPLDGEPLVSHLRIVDKYSVAPPTTYIGSEFPKVLAKENVEYKQANLTVPTTVASVFDPPEGREPYSIVFDLTGDTSIDRPEQIQINHTANVARIIGLEAARRKVKAYVRMQQPLYECPDKGPRDEKEDYKPLTSSGIWWHEALRMLGAIEGLNLVIVRIGLVYGPYVNAGLMATVLTVASVYGYMKRPMKSLWSPGKNPMSTIHVDDVARGLWACALWMSELGRAEADKVAGEIIHFRNEKSKVSEVEGMPAAETEIVAPLFNLTDDNDTTLFKAGDSMCRLFGTKFEFHNFVTSTMFRVTTPPPAPRALISTYVFFHQFRLEDVVEEINEAHVGAWAEMITKSNPPCPNTSLSAYMDVFSLQKHTIAFSNSKIKRIVGFNLARPTMTQETLLDIVDKWKAEGSWPKLEEE